MADVEQILGDLQDELLKAALAAPQGSHARVSLIDAAASIYEVTEDEDGPLHKPINLIPLLNWADRAYAAINPREAFSRESARRVRGELESLQDQISASLPVE
jgi:hypothetical protein